ncbi:SusD/RagB family nutrient-binding outer membrane lipoprotein [Dinghuibacter silviterrae]|uniref:SusD/RagB-like outer membrane lipoprotein n=1 Tax=Dinghuibacter silviterrae TaxID=1539049 RepID=A0A4V3GKI6_9BACT|nr:SusD/RagB family nutrient-binding outer membrane lipoprotein [Dinghuibacter silviterrae]TDW95802.1 SusD/RagB-like outer membrane lipoprotein [Dinghuibacter silviterrae]
MNHSFRYRALLLLSLAGLGGCTKNFDKYNTDNTGLTSSQFQIGKVYPGIQTAIFGEENAYQLDQNLNADCYAGYMMSPDPFRGNINNLSYSLVDGWNQNPWNDAYTLAMGPINAIEKAGIPASAPDFWAIALILKVETMDRLTDKFGPIALSQVGLSVLSTPYDAQQSVYQQFFGELDTAVANLQAYIAANPGSKPFASFDLVYGGDYTEWLKFANSLRLRLAMHLTKIDVATAQAQAEKALAASGGLMSVPADNAAVSGGGYHNPLFVITTSWTDISMGAPVESYMVGYNDPRLPKYCSPATDSRFAGQYVGIRIGSAITAKPGYTGYSTLNPQTCVASAQPMLMMTAAEVWFLKAEAALRGWTGAGTAQTDYETGITTSMNQWGVSPGAYLTDATSTPANYTDPGNAANNATAASTITIAWNPAATNEQMLERIITQKWIAMFPEGQEAWTEYRRTGYPKLFPVVNNNSNGTIDSQIQIRRLAYPQNEYSTNNAAVTAAVKVLGGPDNGGSRLWWDVNKGNF